MHRPALVACALGAVLLTALLTACTSTTAPPSATGTSTESPGHHGITGASTPTDTGGPATGSPPTAPPPITTTLGTLPSSATSPTTTPSPPAPKASINTTPVDGATGVSPIRPVTARVAGGTLRTVTLINPEGRVVKSTLGADRLSWRSSEPLGYGRTYRLQATAVNPGGQVTSVSLSFTTLKPVDTIYPSFFPNPELTQVGIGQPMVVIFDKPPTNRQATERALKVTTVPAVQGSWYWMDDRTVHYRPKTFWKPGTKITVQAAIYGIDLGGGMYGETDRTLRVTIGPSRIAKIDDATKQMKIYVADKLVDTVPVSMGMDGSVTVDGNKITFLTPSGTYVVQEKYKVKQMSSASYGLPTTYDLGYDQAIPLAVRISNSGIFVHSAPWSVADQGVRNVSHGCININPTAAQWFYDTFSYGDIVTVTGTAATLQPDDGFGDWNLSWSQWQNGSAL